MLFQRDVKSEPMSRLKRLFRKQLQKMIFNFDALVDRIRLFRVAYAVVDHSGCVVIDLSLIKSEKNKQINEFCVGSPTHSISGGMDLKDIHLQQHIAAVDKEKLVVKGQFRYLFLSWAARDSNVVILHDWPNVGQNQKT